MSLYDLLDHCVEQGATDLLISPKTLPMLRIERQLEPFGEPVNDSQVEEFVDELCGPAHRDRLSEHGSADLSMRHNGQDFRVSIFRQRGTYSLAIRYLKPDLPDLNDLRLPSEITDLLQQDQGVVFVTGAAGTGKTTTINSMLNHLNTTSRRHIITLEDPIEYRHEHQQSMIDQREIGRDVSSFQEGIRSGVRMDPDVLFVGEMRGPETMQAAITAAETGHLVFSTLHTRSAPQSINRVIDAFEPRQQNQVRAQLSMTISAVLTQRLLPKKDEDGMVAAFEVMVGTTAIGNMIRDERVEQIESAIQTGEKAGMRTLEQDLAELTKDGLIARTDAARAANDEKAFQSALTNARQHTE